MAAQLNKKKPDLQVGCVCVDLLISWVSHALIHNLIVLLDCDSFQIVVGICSHFPFISFHYISVLRSSTPATMAFSHHESSETSSQRSTSLDDIPCRGNPTERQTFPQAHRKPIDLCDHGLTYSSHMLSAAELQHQHLRGQRPCPLPPAADPIRPRVPSRRCRMNMDVTVDLEGILPEGIQDLRTGHPLVNVDSIRMCTFYSDSQLHNLTVDYIKKAIQDLCWECFRLTIRKRDFKLWLQCYR